MPYRHNGEDHFKGHGWTRRRAEGWERVFGKKAERCNNKVTTPKNERCWPGERTIQSK